MYNIAFNLNLVYLSLHPTSRCVWLDTYLPSRGACVVLSQSPSLPSFQYYGVLPGSACHVHIEALCDSLRSRTKKQTTVFFFLSKLDGVSPAQCVTSLYRKVYMEGTICSFVSPLRSKAKCMCLFFSFDCPLGRYEGKPGQIECSDCTEVSEMLASCMKHILW